MLFKRKYFQIYGAFSKKSVNVHIHQSYFIFGLGKIYFVGGEAKRNFEGFKKVMQFWHSLVEISV